MIVRAREYEAAVLEKLNGPDGPDWGNYTGYHMPGRFYDGRLVELAFSRHLLNIGIVHIDMVRADGMPDQGDITIFMGTARRPIIIDVKGSRANSPSIMVFVSKMALDLGKPIRAYSVGQIYGERYSDTLVSVQGWATKPEVAAAPIRDWGKGPTHTLFNQLLRPLDTLIRDAQGGKDAQYIDQYGFAAGFSGG